MDTSLTWLDRLINTPDASDWQKLSIVYEPLLRNWIRKAGVPDSDSDDVVQEVLMVVVRRIPDFEHRFRGAFRGWLRSILSTQLKRYFRTHARRPALLELDSLIDSSSPESVQFDREHNELIAERAMQRIQHEFAPRTWDAFRLQILHNTVQ
jgi:RNA polymerase sigma-70 factor (ECF subfamily)